jgi:PKD repeat protein
MDNLSCGATYSERVRAWDSGGLVSEWSGSASYTTPPLNHAPTAYNLQATQLGDYCAVGPHASFSWNYTDVDGDQENSWQIQVDNNSDFSSPEADSGRVYSTSNAYSTTNLNYNTNYYWRVRVWDSKDVVSSWISGPSFAPPRHRYPTVNFSWSPTAPSANENILFADQSSVYGGASKASWSWSFQNGAPGTSNQQNPTIKFTAEGNKQVSLRVTDSDGYACTGYKNVNVNLPLPKWKEITPR